MYDVGREITVEQMRTSEEIMQNNPSFGSHINQEGGEEEPAFTENPIGFFLKKSKTVVEKGSETLSYGYG